MIQCVKSLPCTTTLLLTEMNWASPRVSWSTSWTRPTLTGGREKPVGSQACCPQIMSRWPRNQTPVRNVSKPQSLVFFALLLFAHYFTKGPVWIIWLCEKMQCCHNGNWCSRRIKVPCCCWKVWLVDLTHSRYIRFPFHVRAWRDWR